MIVCCKKRFGLNVLRNIFYYRPGDGKPVISGSSSSDFVQNEQRLLRRIAKNIGNLTHFHHESGLPLCKIIRSTDPRKNPIADRESCFFRRNKGTDCRQEDDECNLSHIRRLSCHVRTGDNRDFFILIKDGIIRNKLPF